MNNRRLAMLRARRRQRALAYLAKAPASELVDQPLEVTRELRAEGLAAVGRTYSKFHNGKIWNLQEIVLTDAGRRAALATRPSDRVLSDIAPLRAEGSEGT